MLRKNVLAYHSEVEQHKNCNELRKKDQTYTIKMEGEK